MARGRIIMTTISSDKRLNSLTLEAQLVYLMAIPHLDRDGLVEGDSPVLFGKVCPRRTELAARIPDIIDEWCEAGLVVRYETDNGDVLWFRGFGKNQPGMRYDREYASVFPAPPGTVRTENGLEEIEPRQSSGNVPEDRRQSAGNLPDNRRKSAGNLPHADQDRGQHRPDDGADAANGLETLEYRQSSGSVPEDCRQPAGNAPEDCRKPAGNLPAEDHNYNQDQDHHHHQHQAASGGDDDDDDFSGEVPANVARAVEGEEDDPNDEESNAFWEIIRASYPKREKNGRQLAAILVRVYGLARCRAAHRLAQQQNERKIADGDRPITAPLAYIRSILENELINSTGPPEAPPEGPTLADGRLITYQNGNYVLNDEELAALMRDESDNDRTR